GRPRPQVRRLTQLQKTLADRQSLAYYAGRNEDQEFGLAGGPRVIPEEEPDVRQLPEERNARQVLPLGFFVDPADDDRSAVFDEGRGLHVLGADLHACRGGCAGLILVDVEFHDHVAFRRDLRLYLEREVRLAEGNRRGPRRRSLLVRNLGSLL